MRKLTRYRLLLAAVAGLGLTAGSASAFYWQGWPGSGVPQPKSLVPPTDTARPGNPPGSPPTIPAPTFNVPPDQAPPPDTVPPDVPGDHPPPPSSVPEPATGALGLLGLAAVGWWRRRK